jgi:predicted AAA+ superfamily ATPase
MDKYVQRPLYLAFLKRWQNKHIIKVISGVRRAGKSTLFYQEAASTKWSVFETNYQFEFRRHEV